MLYKGFAVEAEDEGKEEAERTRGAGGVAKVDDDANDLLPLLEA